MLSKTCPQNTASVRFIVVNREMRKMEIIHYFSIMPKPQFLETDPVFLEV